MSMMHTPRCLLAACLLLGSVVGHAQQALQPDTDSQTLQTEVESSWYPVRDDSRQGIRTWARQEDDKPWRSFRVEAKLPGTLEQVQQIFFDFAGYKRWYWQVTEVQLLKTVSANEYYLYIVHNAPLNIPDRDVILHTRIEPRSGSQNVARIRISAEPEYLPLRPPLVRMLAEDMVITLTPVGNETLLQAEGRFHSGGNEPLWVSNSVQRNAPYTMVAGLARLVRAASGTTATPFRLTQTR